MIKRGRLGLLSRGQGLDVPEFSSKGARGRVEQQLCRTVVLSELAIFGAELGRF